MSDVTNDIHFKDASRNVERAYEDVTSLFTSIESLDSIAHTLGDTVLDSPAKANAVHTAIRAGASGLGLEDASLGLPDAQNHDGATAAQATDMTRNRLFTILKSFWTRLTDFVKRLWERLEHFYQLITENFTVMALKADALSKRVSHTGVKKISRIEPTLKNVQQASLGTNRQEDILETENVKKAIKQLSQGYAQGNQFIAKLAAEWEGSLSSSDDRTVAIVWNYKNIIPDLANIAPFQVERSTKTQELDEIYSSGIDGQQIVVQVKHAKDKLPSIAVSENHLQSKDTKQTVEVDVLEARTLHVFAKTLAEQCLLAQKYEYRGDRANAEKLINRLSRAIATAERGRRMDEQTIREATRFLAYLQQSISVVAMINYKARRRVYLAIKSKLLIYTQMCD